jgi:AcrR family transcriptional regulator
MHAVRSSGQPASERKLRAQGRRTLAKLLDAGLQAFGERGYHAARVDDVVRLAATSHGTFYLYFSNKEDLVRTLAEECVAEITAAVDRLGPVDPGPAGIEELRSWLEQWKDAYERYGPVVRIWMEDHVPDPALMRLGGKAYDEITSALEARIREAAPSHIDPRLAAPAMLAMIERLFYYVLSRGLALDDEALLGTLAVMLHRGFFGGLGGEAGQGGQAPPAG